MTAAPLNTLATHQEQKDTSTQYIAQDAGAFLKASQDGAQRFKTWTLALVRSAAAAA